MFSHKRRFMIIGGLLLLGLISCSREHSGSSLRVVSLSPAMTETLFSLDAGDKIVGVTTYCDFPPQAKKIRKVGDFSHPSIERIVALKPNLVIVNLPEQKRIKNELDKLEIETFVSSPKSLQDIYKEITAIGNTLGLERQADSVINYMKQHIQAVETAHRKSVYVEISPKPLITIGAATFLNDLINAAGGENIFSDLEQDYPVVGQEAVIRRNPEIIILLHPEDASGRTGWQNIKAIKNGKVFTNLNQDHLMRPGPRLVNGFQELKEIISD